MPRDNTTNLLTKLDELKNQFTPAASRGIERLLEQLSRKKFNDTESLFHYHEILLFLRAYPQTTSIVRSTEKELRGLQTECRTWSEKEIDISALEHPEVSGVAGTSVTDTFSFYIVRWLQHRHSITGGN